MNDISERHCNIKNEVKSSWFMVMFRGKKSMLTTNRYLSLVSKIQKDGHKIMIHTPWIIAGPVIYSDLERLQGQHATQLHTDHLQILYTGPQKPKSLFWIHQQRWMRSQCEGCMGVTAKHSYVKQCSLKTKSNQGGI